MPSFKDARDLSLLLYLEGMIDEDEFTMLHNLNTSGNSPYPYENYERFHLEDKDSYECKAEFRKKEIFLYWPRLFGCLRFSIATKEQYAMG